jgi:hypothetical protein
MMHTLIFCTEKGLKSNLDSSVYLEEKKPDMYHWNYFENSPESWIQDGRLCMKWNIKNVRIFLTDKDSKIFLMSFMVAFFCFKYDIKIYKCQGYDLV